MTGNMIQDLHRELDEILILADNGDPKAKELVALFNQRMNEVVEQELQTV